MPQRKKPDIFHMFAAGMKGGGGRDFLYLILSLISTDHKYNIKAETNWPPFLEDIFKCIFWNENISILIKILLTFVPMGPINSVSSTGSDNGLVPIRRQPIIWTNDD